MDIEISREDERRIVKALDGRQDTDALRMKRYLGMPDLSRTPGSPLYELVQRARCVPSLKDLDNIIIPEIVPASVSFDLFDFAADHPAGILHGNSPLTLLDKNHRKHRRH